MVIIEIYNVPNLLIVSIASFVIVYFLCNDSIRSLGRIEEKQAELQRKLVFGNGNKGVNA